MNNGSLTMFDFNKSSKNCINKSLTGLQEASRGQYDPQQRHRILASVWGHTHTLTHARTHTHTYTQ